MLSLVHAVLAQVPSLVPGDDMFGWVLSSMKWAVEKFQAGDYAPAIGIVIMVLVAIFHKFFENKINKKALPWVSAGIGILVACATNFMALKAGYTGKEWMAAVVSGFMVGAAASGFWSMAGKFAMDKLKEIMGKLSNKSA